MTLPKRKHPRLKNYDYGQDGCYFVTICTKDRRKILSSVVVGRDDLIPPQIRLTKIGEIVEKYILGIESAYQTMFLDSYVIMPDHIHLLIRIDNTANGGMGSSRPTLDRAMKALKGLVTRELDASIWQASFFDEIIRSEQAWCEACRYIEGNPTRWTERN